MIGPRLEVENMTLANLVEAAVIIAVIFVAIRFFVKRGLLALSALSPFSVQLGCLNRPAVRARHEIYHSSRVARVFAVWNSNREARNSSFGRSPTRRAGLVRLGRERPDLYDRKRYRQRKEHPPRSPRNAQHRRRATTVCVRVNRGHGRSRRPRTCQAFALVYPDSQAIHGDRAGRHVRKTERGGVRTSGSGRP